MQHYYLDLREGEKLVPDSEGENFTNVAAARDKSIITIRELICESVGEGTLPLHHMIEVRDSNRILILTIRFGDAIEIIFG